MVQGQTRAADSSDFKALCLFSSGKPPIPAGICVLLKADGLVGEGTVEKVEVARSTGLRLPLFKWISPCCEPHTSIALFFCDRRGPHGDEN